MKDYWIKDDKIIFKPKFNKSVDNFSNIVSNYKVLIFSNYSDHISCCECDNAYENDYDIFHEHSLFNKQIDNLPSCLIKIDTGGLFNKKINTLPSSIIKLTYNGTKYEMNNLPNSITFLRINSFYRNKIKKMSIKTKIFIYGNKHFKVNIKKNSFLEDY